MNAGHFLHCRDCETIFRPSPHDRAPEFRMTADGFTETPRDDCMEFLTRHARHQLETLRPTTPRAFYTGALWDADASTFWEVSNGERTAVIEGRRSQVGTPIRYRLRAGRVVEERTTVEIPADDIRQQIDRALYPGVAPARKLAAFVEAFKAMVWAVDPATLEIVCDVSADPRFAIARLASTDRARLSDQVRRIFDEAESAKIVAALAGTDGDPDGFTVLVRQRVRVEG
ncbi:MAG: hypothetical protein ABIR79_12610 [Candidatus Binatia bacterium]